MSFNPHINDIIQSWGNLGFKTTSEAREFILSNKDWKSLIKMKLKNTHDIDIWREMELDKRMFMWLRGWSS